MTTNIDQFYEQTLPADCPHCGVRRVAFTIRGGCSWIGEDHQDCVDLFAQCGHCYQGIIARFDEVQGQGLGRMLAEGDSPSASFPTRPPQSAPPHTPEDVAHYFIQGKENMTGNWDAAGAMFRKALEVSLQEKFPDIEDTLTLFQRIEEAAKRHTLNPDLAEWTHYIRKEGNKAVHERKRYEKEDAVRLEVFTKMLLEYLFTLPGMLAEGKKKLSPS